jgi:hypothetical protein
MKNLLRLILCLSLSCFAIGRAVTAVRAATKTATKTTAKPATDVTAGAKKPTGKRADAKTLIHDAKKALAAMVKDARADKGLDPKTAKNKPFWKSTQSLAKSLKTAEAGLAAKNNDFFKGIENARQAEAQMKVDWELTDSNNKGVIENGKKLGHALAALRTDFSKEAARKKKGGDLTADEKAQFEKIKAQQKELLAKLDKLQAKAKKDKALEKGLAEIKKQANDILKKPTTLDAYLAALYLLDTQTGLIRGYQYYVDKDWRDDYVWFVNYAKWYDTWYVDWVTPGGYDWVYVDTPVDLYYDVDVPDTLTDSDIADQDTFVENEPVDMTDAEENEVAAEEDADADVADNDDSMDDASDDEGEDLGDEGGDDDGDDDGGDDGGEDGGDDGGDDGE